jgi:hypothetical protein
MTGERKIFSHLDDDISDFDNITFGDDSKGGVKGIGEVHVSKDYNLFNVLLVDSLNFNLLSIAQLCDNGYKCTFISNYFEVTSLDGKDVKFEKDKLCSACQAGKQVANLLPIKNIMSSTRLNYYIWIYLVPLPIEVLVEIPIVL